MNQKTASAPAAENKMGTMPIGRLLFNMSLPQFLLPSRYRCCSLQLQPVPALV